MQTTARSSATYLRNSGPLIWRQLLAGARRAGVVRRSIIRSHRWLGWIDWVSRPRRDRTCRHSEIRGHERVRADLVQFPPQAAIMVRNEKVVTRTQTMSEIC